MLTIAQANIEAMLDGVAEITRERLEAVHGALVTASSHLKALTALSKEE